MEIYNFWVPKKQSLNDKNIMDVAFDDDVIKKPKWKMIRHINQCRLYLRAFTLEDLTLDRVNVYAPYLEGTERGKIDKIAIPEVCKPTKNQWRLWKSFIFRNFLSPGTRINPPLGDSI